MQSPGKIPALQGLVLVKSLLKVPAPGELLPDSWAFIMNPCNKPNTKSQGFCLASALGRSPKIVPDVRELAVQFGQFVRDDFRKCTLYGNAQ